MVSEDLPQRCSYEGLRIDKMEDVLSRLTEISGDLHRMLAVHDERLSQQEKQTIAIVEILEKRRDETESKIKTIYDTMHSESKLVEDKVFTAAEARNKQIQDVLRDAAIGSEQRHIQIDAMTNRVDDKINSMNRVLWLYSGGMSVIVFFLMYGPRIIESLSYVKK